MMNGTGRKEAGARIPSPQWGLERVLRGCWLQKWDIAGYGRTKAKSTPLLDKAPYDFFFFFFGFIVCIYVSVWSDDGYF